MPTDDIRNLLQGVQGGGIGSSIHFAPIFIGIAFSLVGWGAWRYGRRIQSGRHMILAVALMAYPYFVWNTWWSLATGSVLTGLLFWP